MMQMHNEHDVGQSCGTLLTAHAVVTLVGTPKSFKRCSLSRAEILLYALSLPVICCFQALPAAAFSSL